MKDASYHSSNAELESKNKVELLAHKPGHSVSVLCNSQRLSANTKDEAASVHEPYLVPQSAQSKNDLTSEDQAGEDDRSQSDAKDAIDQVSAQEAEDHIGPAVVGVELGESGRCYLEVPLEVVLKRGRVVIAKVRSKAEQAHEYERKVSEVELPRIAHGGHTTTAALGLTRITTSIGVLDQWLRL